MLSIGLDIGTTKICAAIIDAKSGESIKTLSCANDTFIESSNSYEKAQNPDNILEKCIILYKSLISEYKGIACVGVTGQMHGILYLDKDGDACSSLYTWQDARGELIFKDGKSYVTYMTEKSGMKVASGYGAVTHFYNTLNNLVPKDAVTFCTIHDYVAMKLLEEKIPLIHPSDAASFGLYDLEKSSFCEDKIATLGMNFSLFPHIAADFQKLGETKENIPVFIAIGDNQASVIGSISGDSSVLVNVGTGSQITIICDKAVLIPNVECRPYIGNSYLLVGSSLCGGRAFAILEGFFRSVVEMANGGEKSPSLYPMIDKLMENPSQAASDVLLIDTSFNGTRENPQKRAGIENISIDNFTARCMIEGTLTGIAKELYDYFLIMEAQNIKKPTQLVGSGNGIKKNKYLQNVFSNMFGMPLLLPDGDEQAAFGACLFALVGVGAYDSITKAQELIKYR